MLPARVVEHWDPECPGLDLVKHEESAVALGSWVVRRLQAALAKATTARGGQQMGVYPTPQHRIRSLAKSASVAAELGISCWFGATSLPGTVNPH